MGFEDDFFTENCSTPLCQQFDSFLEHVPYAIEDSILELSTAIVQLKVKDKEEFMQSYDEFLKGYASDYDESRGNGSDDPETDRFLREWYSEVFEDDFEKCSSYRKGITRLFHMILDQLDDIIRLELQFRENWRDIDFKCDAIEVLKSLREACYGINVGRMHPLTDIIRKRRNFVTCMQKKGY